MSEIIRTFEYQKGKEFPPDERKPRPFIFADLTGAKFKINKFKINKTFSVMKTFQTIEEAASFISKHNESSSHKEKDINEVVMFGMGCVYAYRKEAAKAGLCEYDHSSAFYHIKNESELLTLLAWLQDNDGYLIAA